MNLPGNVLCNALRNVLGGALSIALPLVAAPSVAATPPNCASVEQRQFDFWVGDWDVFLPDGSKAGENRIEKLAADCALLENWRGAGGVVGHSLNLYDLEDRKWHQFWVDSSGSHLSLEGAFAGGKMTLSARAPDPARPGATLIQRIVWTPNADGSVRQLWETSKDEGKTWATAFDGKYVRKRRAAS